MFALVSGLGLMIKLARFLVLGNLGWHIWYVRWCIWNRGKRIWYFRILGVALVQWFCWPVNLVFEIAYIIFKAGYLAIGKVYLVFERLGVALVWGLGSMILPASPPALPPPPPAPPPPAAPPPPSPAGLQQPASQSVGPQLLPTVLDLRKCGLLSSYVS